MDAEVPRSEAEVVENATKVQTALRLSEDDQATINGLKQEIEQAWKLVDATKEKEARTAAASTRSNARWLTWSAPPSRAPKCPRRRTRRSNSSWR